MEAVAEEAYQQDFTVEAVGDRHVIVLSRIRIVGKGSGASYESEYGAFYEIRDGRGVRGSAFLSHDEARRARSRTRPRAAGRPSRCRAATTSRRSC